MMHAHGDVAALHTDFSLTPTLFRTQSDLGWCMAALMHLPPAESIVGVIFDDVGASVTDPIVAAAAETRRHTIAVRTIIPSQQDKSKFEGIQSAVQGFIRQAVRTRLRYVLLAMDVSPAYGVLACELVKQDLASVLNVMTLGVPTYAVAAIRAGEIPCEGVDVEVVAEAILMWGWVGVHPEVPEATVDLRVNLETGNVGSTDAQGTPVNTDLNLAGLPWDMALSMTDAAASEGCQDDEVALQEAATIRTALGVADDALTCDMVVFLGQSRRDATALTVAKLCPVSVCQYNRLSPACRVSCACTEPPTGLLERLVAPLQVPANELVCLSGPESLRHILDWQGGYSAETVRCSGVQCRQIYDFNLGPTMPSATLPSATAFRALFTPFAHVGASAPEGFCPSTYPGCATSQAARIMQAEHSGPPLSDGVWALAMAFRCVENRHGAEGLTRLAQYDYSDAWVAREMSACLKEEVEFEGYQGRVDFSYLQSPKPGSTPAGLVQVPETLARGYITMGYAQPTAAAVFHRAVIRNTSKCTEWDSTMAPGFTCPEGDEIAYVLDLKNDMVIPLGRPSSCPPGTFPLAIGERSGTLRVDECAPCYPGTFRREDTGARCLPCEPGRFSGPGAVGCDVVPVNNRSQETTVVGVDGEEVPRTLMFDLGLTVQTFGAQGFAPCPSGEIAQPGSPACTACPDNQARESDVAAKCVVCEAGSFRNENKECERCPETYTTTVGARSREACRCPQGKYENKKERRCEDCQPNAICMGGNDIPLVEDGYFAELRPVGATMETFERLEIWKCPFKDACPATLKIPNGQGFALARNYSLAECSDPRMTRWCSRCPANMYIGSQDVTYEVKTFSQAGGGTWEVGQATENLITCVDCGGGGSVPFPLFLVALCMFIYCIYRFTQVPRNQGLTAALMLSSLCSLLMTIFQTLAVIGLFSISLPGGIKEIMMVMGVFTFDIEVLNAQCVTGTDFRARYLWRVVTPMIFLGGFYVTMLASQLANKFVKRIVAMEKAKTLNALGLCASAAYIPLCKMSFQFFECQQHPTAPSTLVAYPDIACGDDDRTGIMGVGVLAVLAYPIFIYATMATLCFIAPRMFTGNPTFKTGTGFLLSRWKPTIWYFGPAVMLRNLCFALIGVAYPSDGIAQLVLASSILSIYAAFQSTQAPWRSGALNRVDTVLTITVSVLCMFLLTIVPMEDEKEVRLDRYRPYVMLFFLFAMATMVGMLLYAVLFLFGKIGPSKKATENATKTLMDAVKEMNRQIQSQEISDEKIYERLGQFLTVQEQTSFASLLQWTLQEVFNVSVATGSGKGSRRLSMNTGSTAERGERDRRMSLSKSSESQEKVAPSE